MKMKSLVITTMLTMSVVTILSTTNLAFGDEIRGLGDKCLEVEGGRATNGTFVRLNSCHGGDNQQWWYNSKSHEIRGLGGKCMEVCVSGSCRDRIVINRCNGSEYQQWEYISSRREIRNWYYDDMCLEVQGRRPENGSYIIWSTCDGSASQQWRFVN